MGSFLPVILALVLNLANVFVFVEVKLPGCGPYLSLLIFSLAMFIFLWNSRLYPATLRKLGNFGTKLVEFFIACFLMEHILSDFWLPLEEAAIAFLPKVAEGIDYLGKQAGISLDTVTGLLKDEQICMYMSYVLSLFFLVGVLHATRIIDLRLLKCGFGVFFNDVTRRFQKFKCRLLQIIGGCGQKCVQFDDEIYNFVGQEDDPDFDPEFKDFCDNEETDSEDCCPRSRRRCTRRHMLQEGDIEM